MTGARSRFYCHQVDGVAVALFLLAAEQGFPEAVNGFLLRHSSSSQHNNAERFRLYYEAAAWVVSEPLETFVSSPSPSPSPPLLGELEPLRIQGQDTSFAGNMGIPTFALRRANVTWFQAPSRRDGAGQQRRGLEACIQPGPAFVLDHVLSPRTCQALVDLVSNSNSSFGEYSAGKNHHGALQLLVPADVANQVAQTLVPHIDMNLLSGLQERQAVQFTNFEHEEAHAATAATANNSKDNKKVSYTCMGLNRRWRIYRYAPHGKDRFAPHIDAGFPPSGETTNPETRETELVYDDSQGRPVVSRLTFLLYLNDDFVGGETNFFEPLLASSARQEKQSSTISENNCSNAIEPRIIASVRPKQGSCLVFPQGVGEDAVAYARQHWPLHEGSPVISGSPKYVIRSDVLFLEEEQKKEDYTNGGGADNNVLFQHDEAVRQVFCPKPSSSIVDPIFLSHVNSLYNPLMGSENLGQLLYSLVRFTKKRRIVEVGFGYTSLYLLQALQDNQKEMEEIGNLQREGKCRLLDWSWTAPSIVDDYFREESLLLCIGNGSNQKEHATGASAVARSLGLDSLLEFIPENPFDVKLHDVDIIWMDVEVGPRIPDFVQNVWPSIRPGGFLLCHSTLTNQCTREWLESVRERAPSHVTGLPPNEGVELSLLEPHKHYQNSISILQKRTNYEEPVYSIYAKPLFIPGNSK